MRIGLERGARRSRMAVAALSAAAVALALAAPAMAQTFTVTNLSDTGVEGDGSLRGEVKAANASPGLDSIAFAPGVTGAIRLHNSGITITDAVDIEGPGPGALTVEQETANHRVFLVELASPGPVTFAGLHFTGGSTKTVGGDVDDAGGSESLNFVDCLITGGSAEGDGGGVFSDSPTNLTRTTVSGNHAKTNIGGIGVNEEFTVRGSTISGNVSENGTGGFYGEVYGHGLGLIEDSTFSGNRSRGIALDVGSSASIVVRNSTIADNEEGAAELYTREGGTLMIIGSTIADNLRPGASSIFIGEGGFYTQASTLEDTIVAGNTSGANPEIKGPINAAFSLVGNPKGVALTETVPGSDLLGVDPLLGPLADNGGGVATMALPATSPAVNKGAAFGLTADARGDPRPSLYPGLPLATAPGADGSDIGAYELQAPAVPAPPAPGGGSPTTSPPPPPAPTHGGGAPKVRLVCPRSAGTGGCRFALQIVSGRPRRVGKGAGAHVVKPTAESAIAKLKLAAGASGLLALTPKPKFAEKLDAAGSLLVRETTTVAGNAATAYRRLKVVG